MKTIFTSVLIFLVITFTHAQSNQTIRGRVIDDITKYPLIGALVSVTTFENSSALTDEQGYFEINNIPLGRQSIEVSYIGYKTYFADNLLLVSGKEYSIEITMQEEAIEIKEITVSAKSNNQTALNEMASVSARSISIEQTERFAGSLGDPARMAGNYAGVAIKDDSRNDIIIRGNSPSGVLWRLEGIEIPNPNHFGAMGATGGPVSMINNNLLSTSDFLTGAFPAEYGNALAGAFDLHLRNGNSKNYEYTGQIGFNGFELGAEGPIKKSNNLNQSFLINYRYSTLAIFNAMGFDVGTGSAVPQYQDLTYNINLPTAKAGSFKVFGLAGKSFIMLGRDYADTSANLYNSRGTATDFGSNLIVSGFSHTYYFTPNIRLKSTISFQSTSVLTVFDSIKNNKTVMPFYRQTMNEQKLSVQQQYKQKINKKNNISAGYSIDFYKENLVDSVYISYLSSFKKGIDVQGNLSLIQAYAQYQYKPTQKFTTYFGLHSQYFSLNKQVVLEPRFLLKYDVTNKQSLTLGYGIHNQTQAKVLYFFQKYDTITNTYLKTNKDVKFTQNIHIIGGYNLRFAKQCQVKFEVYYQELSKVPVSKDFPEYSVLNTGADFGFSNVLNLENTGTGTNKGIELTVERFLNNGYYFLITGSFFDSKYTGYDKVERNTAFNGNYIVNALAGYEYKISDKFMLTFDARATNAGGKRYVPIDVEESRNQHDLVYDWSHAFENKYDPYFRTDIRIGFKQNSKKYSQEWGLDLQNITNYKSVFMENYDADKDEVYKVFQQGFMPMMLYRIQF